MLTRIRPGWAIPENRATPEGLFRDRRRLLQGFAAAPVLAATSPLLAACDEAGEGDQAATPDAQMAEAFVDPTADLYPAPRNERYMVDRPVTAEALATRFNNFYEFGSHKTISEAAQVLPTRPWQVRIDGLVEREMNLDIDDLIRRMPLEERLCRFRCVEAWSMTVPWTGFPMRALVELAQPTAAARYLRMETFFDPEVSSAHRSNFGYPWPYVEGLTMAEATNDMTLLVTGAYGRPAPPQMGAPLRLITPWKYGFKSIKSIIRFSFVAERPLNFWQEIASNEYGFWANVNPEVSHPRWSQATERVMSDGPSPLWDRVPTLPWNGYGEFVADMYSDLADEPLFM